MEVDPGLFPMLRDGGSALLVPPEDPIRLAAAVERVMSDPELRLRLSRGATTLSKQFTWGAIARRHLEVYGDLARIR
jgi:glycosyltransferase involved in cell wall biosynthesis